MVSVFIYLMHSICVFLALVCVIFASEISTHCTAINHSAKNSSGGRTVNITAWQCYLQTLLLLYCVRDVCK